MCFFASVIQRMLKAANKFSKVVYTCCPYAPEEMMCSVACKWMTETKLFKINLTAKHSYLTISNIHVQKKLVVILVAIKRDLTLAPATT